MIKFIINRDLIKKDLHRIFTVLTVVTNCFIISGVIHHWKPKAKPIYNYTNDNTQLAKAQQQIAKIQKETTYGTSCTQAYQNTN
jgi:hypothetical protein